MKTRLAPVLIAVLMLVTMSVAVAQICAGTCPSVRPPCPGTCPAPCSTCPAVTPPCSTCAPVAPPCAPVCPTMAPPCGARGATVVPPCSTCPAVTPPCVTCPKPCPTCPCNFGKGSNGGVQLDKLRKELCLTDDQVARIKDIHDAFNCKYGDDIAKLRDLHCQVMTIMFEPCTSRTADVLALQSQIRDIRARVMDGMTQMYFDMKCVLSPDQQQRLGELWQKGKLCNMFMPFCEGVSSK